MTTQRPASPPRGAIGRILLLVVPTAWAVAGVMAIVAPTDAVQGPVQRLMYLHVPSAWTAFLCFALVCLASLANLRRDRPAADRLARAAAEIGVVMTTLTLATGSLWGSATWGTWWVWDARVTSTVAMGLVYLGYLALRGLARGPRGRRGVALVGTAGFGVVPIVHFSVLWWRTLHQPPTILDPSLSLPIESGMLAALGAAVLAFTATVLWALRRRIARLARRREAEPDAAEPAPTDVLASRR